MCISKTPNRRPKILSTHQLGTTKSQLTSRLLAGSTSFPTATTSTTNTTIGTNDIATINTTTFNPKPDAKISDDNNHQPLNATKALPSEQQEEPSGNTNNGVIEVTPSSDSNSTSLTTKKRIRKRRQQKPGKTAKMNDRHFVVHNYHDHANDREEDVLWCTKEQEEQLKPNRRGGVKVSFPFKLHSMLDQIEADGLGHIISWQPHGRCFVIHKPKEFTDVVMPKYFKQTKLTSFQRQLNLYGFLRITSGPDIGGYYSELFLRGKAWLAKRMVRIKIKGTGYKAASSPEQEPNFYQMPVVKASDETAPSASKTPNDQEENGCDEHDSHTASCNSSAATTAEVHSSEEDDSNEESHHSSEGEEQQERQEDDNYSRFDMMPPPPPLDYYSVQSPRSTKTTAYPKKIVLSSPPISPITPTHIRTFSSQPTYTSHHLYQQAKSFSETTSINWHCAVPSLSLEEKISSRNSYRPSDYDDPKQHCNYQPSDSSRSAVNSHYAPPEKDDYDVFDEAVNSIYPVEQACSKRPSASARSNHHLPRYDTSESNSEDSLLCDFAQRWNNTNGFLYNEDRYGQEEKTTSDHHEYMMNTTRGGGSVIHDEIDASTADGSIWNKSIDTDEQLGYLLEEFLQD